MLNKLTVHIVLLYVWSQMFLLVSWRVKANEQKKEGAKPFNKETDRVS